MPLGRRMSDWNCAEVLFGQAQLANAHLDAVLVQQPHDDRLAVVGRDDADAQVEFLLAHGDLDPAVLGASAFGDVEFGQNLDTREDGTQQSPGGAIAFDQHAVDPVPDADPVLERLDVDVRRPQLHGLLDHQVDQPHDRGTVFVHHVARGRCRRLRFR